MLGATKLVHEFYANLHAGGKGHFMTSLCKRPIKVDAALICAITHTP